MDKKQKGEILGAFAEAFHEVVVPELEAIKKVMATKEDLEEVATKEDVDRIERKLVKIDDNLERYGNRLDNHEKRVTKLETRPTIS